MANIPKIKKERMLEFLQTLKQNHNDDSSIRAFNEIENHLREKKREANKGQVPKYYVESSH